MTKLRAMFRADWKAALFIHFRVDPIELSRAVPFPLDTLDGDAFVSLVAFTQSNLRPTFGGKLAAMLSAPLAEHAFLNLRAYVRVNNRPAIYFISEWIPNRLAVLIGPRLYGLPYRAGTLRYRHDAQPMTGSIVAPGGAVRYRGCCESGFTVAAPGSIHHFLLERYCAFTCRHGIARRFSVDHAPWPQTRVNIEILDCSLLESAGAWTRRAELIGANYSPGVSDVIISAPQKLPNLDVIPA